MEPKFTTKTVSYGCQVLIAGEYIGLVYKIGNRCWGADDGSGDLTTRPQFTTKKAAIDWCVWRATR